MNTIKKTKYLLLFLLLFSLSSNAQIFKKIGQRVKAGYIYSFGLNVGWENEDELDTFRIAILEKKDTIMSYHITNLCEGKKLKGCPTTVTRYKKIKDIKPAQILFVHKDFNESVDRIYKKITGTNTLLVTDSCRSTKAIMLNFRPSFVVRIEMNEHNLERENIKIPGIFKAVTPDYQEDWEGLYLETDSVLEKQRKITKKQKKEIEERREQINKIKEKLSKIDKELKEKTAAIDEKKKELQEKQKEINEQKTKLSVLASQINDKNHNLEKKTEILNIKLEEIKIQEEKIDEQKVRIEVKTKKLDWLESEIKNKESRIEEQLDIIEKKQLMQYFLIIILLFILGLAFLIYRNYRNKHKANLVLETKNSEINHQKEEIEAQRDEIESQRDLLSDQKDKLIEINKEVKDSIEYAKKIQTAILPISTGINEEITDNFVLYKPKDIISGDFYWYDNVENNFVIAAADCTGHGVPGAFMSMLGISLLREIVSKEYITHTGVILRKLRKEVIRTLKQDEYSQSKDGMDISVCTIDLKTKEMQYSGANNPLYLVREKSKKQIKENEDLTIAAENDKFILYEVKPDKMPIAIYEKMDKFRTINIDILEGDQIYLFSDGFADQFGGLNKDARKKGGKKYKYKSFKNLIVKNAHKSQEEQKILLNKEFTDWKGELEQLDDVVVVGLKI